MELFFGLGAKSILKYTYTNEITYWWLLPGRTKNVPLGLFSSILFATDLNNKNTILKNLKLSSTLSENP